MQFGRDKSNSVEVCFQKVCYKALGYKLVIGYYQPSYIESVTDLQNYPLSFFKY